MKSPGQLLYEHKHPVMVRVVEFDRRQFATSNDAFLVPNPAGHVPWNLLTERCRQSWESSAVGHYLFPEATTC